MDDLANGEIEMTGGMGFAGPDEEPIQIKMALYLVDGVIYAMYDVPLSAPYWMKAVLPPGFKDILTETRGQLKGLKLGDIECLEVIGRERKEGANCYLLQMDTDLKRVVRYLMLAAEHPYTEEIESELAMLDNVISDISMKAWVDVDDYYIVYLTCEFNIEITPEMMGAYGEEGAFSLNATMNARNYDYNKKVEITLPTEAEDAQEIDSW